MVVYFIFIRLSKNFCPAPPLRTGLRDFFDAPQAIFLAWHLPFSVALAASRRLTPFSDASCPVIYTCTTSAQVYVYEEPALQTARKPHAAHKSIGRLRALP